MDASQKKKKKKKKIVSKVVNYFTVTKRILKF